ncbi:MAG: c-type cytochrome [Candidatus Velthaea sp.]
MIAVLGLPLLLAAIAPMPPAQGHQEYQSYCASCHGADLRGGVNAPSLRGVGAAAVDFWITTGRMPAAVPWIEVGHRGAQLSPAIVAKIESYVASVDPSGPAIPQVTAGGNLVHGRALFDQNCEHCHGVGGQGASVGYAQWAPGLTRATITQVAEAIRTGPGEMPRFGERQLDSKALIDVASYVEYLDLKAETSQIPVTSSGPVPEGLLGWLAAGALALLAYAYSRKSSKDKSE